MAELRTELSPILPTPPDDFTEEQLQYLTSLTRVIEGLFRSVRGDEEALNTCITSLSSVRDHIAYCICASTYSMYNGYKIGTSGGPVYTRIRIRPPWYICQHIYLIGVVEGTNDPGRVNIIINKRRIGALLNDSIHSGNVTLPVQGGTNNAFQYDLLPLFDELEYDALYTLYFANPSTGAPANFYWNALSLEYTLT